MKKEIRHHDYTTGSIVSNIWKLALPMIVTNMFQTIFGVVDTIFVGKLGPDAIAGVGMSGTVMFMVMTIAVGITIGVVAMVSRFFGAGDYAAANKVASQSFLLVTIMSAILSVIGILISRPVLHFLGASPAVEKLGMDYMNIMFLGCVTIFYTFQASAVLRGAGDTITPMKIMALSVILNIILDPLLIFGIWIFPRMGVKGAAVATVISRGIGGAIGLYVLFTGRFRIKISLKEMIPDLSVLWRILKLSIPASAHSLIISGSGFVLMRIVGAYGTITTAAYIIGMRVQMLVMMPGFGFAGATSTLVGQNLGAEKPERAEQSAWASAKIYAAIMIAAGIAFFIFSRQLVAIFSKNIRVIEIGSVYVKFMSSAYVFLALGMVFTRALQGAGDAVSPTVITAITSFGLQIPLTLIMPKLFGLGEKGLWFAMAVATAVHGLIAMFWFRRGKWKYKKV